MEYNPNMQKKKTYAFIDASNLFYGGEKSLGWAIDYERLAKYLKEKYFVSKIFYYAGIDIGKYQPEGEIDLDKLINHFEEELKKPDLTDAEILIIDRYIQRAKFYQKLEEFGFELKIKPVKIFGEGDSQTKKANCDVDLTFDLMRLMSQYSGLVILSGDGDFAPILTYLIKKGKKIQILARGQRTAKEIRQLAGGKFTDFMYLRRQLEFKKGSEKANGTPKDAIHV